MSLLKKLSLRPTIEFLKRRLIIFLPFHDERNIVITPFERGASKDNANPKIFSVECRMTMSVREEDDGKFYRPYQDA